MKRKTIIKLLSSLICVAIILLAIVLCYAHNSKRVYIVSGDYVITDKDVIAIRSEDSSNPGTYVTTTMFKDINTSNYYFDYSRSYCLYGGTVEFDQSNYQIIAHAKNNDICYAYFSLISSAPLGVKVVLDNGGKSAIEAKGTPDFSQTSPAGAATYVDSITSTGNTVTLSGTTKLVFYSTTAPTINSDGTYTYNTGGQEGDGCRFSQTTLGEFRSDHAGNHADGTLYLIQLTTGSDGTIPTCANLSNVYAVTNISGSVVTYNTHQTVGQGGGVSETGMYAAGDNYGTSYYFRGAVDNNYVTFGGKTWRIIRVNGDGSVRMIYADTTSPMAKDPNPFNNMNLGRIPETMGYVYTIGSSHGNGSSSMAKTKQEQWYQGGTLTASDKAKIADSGFCADRTSSIHNPVESQYSINQNAYDDPVWFNAYYRLNLYGPTFYCSSEDFLTTSNGLTNPIGLITADELMYAGMIATSSSFTIVAGTSAVTTNYLYMSTPYWTMTPYQKDGCNPNDISTDCRSMVVSNGTELVSTGNVYAFQPVVNIKANIVATSGNGTSGSPYLIS